MKNNYIKYSLFTLAGLFLGWLFFHNSPKESKVHKHSEQENFTSIWTCSMHPQIRMDKPGKCPICAMDLIPLNQSTANIDANAIHLTKEAIELANVMTTIVSKQKPEKELRLYGKIKADERQVQNLVSHIPGRIEKLYVNFTGETVVRGQRLASIYSPELITAQQELIEASKIKEINPEIYEASKEKLRQWRISENQIIRIENSGKIQNEIDIDANASGIVMTKRVNVGDYVNSGAILYELADLSSVWVLFDAYESDLPYLKKGDKIDFTIQAIPGKNFNGTIAFIDPVIDPVTRVSKVRMEIRNSNGIFKPEMFVTGTMQAKLPELSNSIVITKSAVLWTGKRSVVYVKDSKSEEPVFSMREIELGPALGNSYVVLNGLKEGEEIVSQGAFNVDAATQLEGKPSMMNMSEKKEHVNHEHTNAITEKVSFHASGNCDMCKQRIEDAANSVHGVISAIWNVDSKNILVEFNKNQTQGSAIQKAIAKAGHDTEQYKADDMAYNALPECCRYRK